MALEAILYPHESFNMTSNPFCSGGNSNTNCGYDLGLHDDKALFGILNNKIGRECHVTKCESQCPPPLVHNAKESQLNSCSPESCLIDQSPGEAVIRPTDSSGRRKRRRSKSRNNKEEQEIQRMTHIAVERNRRKQMNEYLAILKSLMPPSYVQRGDQASIVGGAINFVKELEQLLQSMEVQKRMKKQQQERQEKSGYTSSPFAEFFTFPKYSASASQDNINNSATTDIEVTMMDSHANLKILSKRRPMQLLKMIVGFQSLGLGIFHLNVTSNVDHMVLYSLSVKVEEGSQLNTVDEIAAAVNQMLNRFQEELFS